jgi:menaquinone-9 beta-reductase
LQYGQWFDPRGTDYPAGDALSFVDPFTGSGLLAAVRSGSMAGRAAAIGQPIPEYLLACRASLHQPFQFAELLRRALQGGWAERLAPLAPSRLLFALTRPK